MTFFPALYRIAPVSCARFLNKPVDSSFNDEIPGAQARLWYFIFHRADHSQPMGFVWQIVILKVFFTTLNMSDTKGIFV